MADASRGPEGILAQARRRRRLQSAIGCGCGLLGVTIPLSYLVLCIVGQAIGMDALSLIGLGMLAAVVAAFVLTQLVWRCPACNKPLSTEGWLMPQSRRICPWCGARLEVDQDQDGRRTSMPYAGGAWPGGWRDGRG